VLSSCSATMRKSSVGIITAWSPHVGHAGGNKKAAKVAGGCRDFCLGQRSDHAHPSVRRDDRKAKPIILGGSSADHALSIEQREFPVKPQARTRASMRAAISAISWAVWIFMTPVGSRPAFSCLALCRRRRSNYIAAT
jgi:hypothetical protein